MGRNMAILKNAVESIQIGMEDFHDEDERRVLSAIRNLYSGVLLLFKYKLQQLSPEGSDEVLLKTKILPTLDETTGKITWKGKGKKTVEVFDIKERLTSLGVENIDWNKVDTLQKIRNDIEHYYSKETFDRMKEAVANAAYIVVQFCEPYLEEKPVDILGQQCWDLMLDISQVYEAELASCKENLESVTWTFSEVEASISKMRCPDCDSQLLKVIDIGAIDDDVIFSCCNCQHENSYSLVIGLAVAEHLESYNYHSFKDCGELISDTCPECGDHTFIIEHSQCVSCFYEMKYTFCKWCESPLTLDDQINEGTCGYCQYKYEKMLKE